MNPGGALLLKVSLARRSAASRLSSACFVESLAICAARRSAELGRVVVGCTDTVTFCLTAIAVSFCLTAIAVSFSISLICPELLATARLAKLVVRAHEVGVAPASRIVWICFGTGAIRTPSVQTSSGVN
jgi:hypothetical protein